jgi:hypothetical protein
MKRLTTSMSVWLLLLASSSTLTTSQLVLENATYHQGLIPLGGNPVCFTPTFMYLVTGTVHRGVGGTLEVVHQNATDKGGDYTVTLSPDILNRTDRMRVDVRILCQFPAAPALFNYTGFALITWPNRPVTMPQLNFGFGNQGDIIVEGFLAPGPNPPPPPPLHCSAQPTKADCVKQPPGINDYCTWCVRKDGSGGGCFEDDAEPPAAGWDCPI